MDIALDTYTARKVAITKFNIIIQLRLGVQMSSAYICSVQAQSEKCGTVNDHVPETTS